MNQERLAGKVAIVTGAGGGIGRAIAQCYAGQGASVACVDISESRAEGTVKLISADGGLAKAFFGDVGVRDVVHFLVNSVEAEFGGIDILVNDAAWMRHQALDVVDEATMDRMFRVCVSAAIWGAQAVAPKMAKRGGGSIVNLCSTVAIRANPDSAAYCAVKGAVAGLTRQLALDLGKASIRVNAIAPGFVSTPIAIKNIGEAGIARRLQTTPLGRLCGPEEIASVALFLATPESSFVNGEIIVVDGGRSAAAL